MTRDRVQLTVLLMLAGGYIVLVGLTILGVLFTPLSQEEGVEIIEEVSKVLPGLIGLVVGNMFSGKQAGSRSDEEDSSAEA